MKRLLLACVLVVALAAPATALAAPSGPNAPAAKTAPAKKQAAAKRAKLAKRAARGHDGPCPFASSSVAY